ncbi:heme-binding beta-barrel domain-containing protein [Homoserinimonas sp. A447]
MIELDASLPPELVPLSWLIGVWEGSGVVNYPVGDETRNVEFGQRISFSHDGFPYLNYNSYTWVGEEELEHHHPLASETGYWRLSRELTDSDPGPGMLPGVGETRFGNADAVEELRNETGGFDIEVALLHPGGVSELYLGQVKGPRIDLGTDAIMRSATAKEHSASTRLYGLVENHLLWAWDIAALGQNLTSHASARLAKVE